MAEHDSIIDHHVKLFQQHAAELQGLSGADFCVVWPKLEPVLRTACDLSAKIPNYGPMVSTGLSLALTALGRVYSANCG